MNIPELLQLLRQKGGSCYAGEALTQTEHARQCALLAEQAGSGPHLVAAALLHDLGHLTAQASDQGLDLQHEKRAMPYLQPLFPESVTEPIRLHVQAKRYLCAVDPTYWRGLSAGSRQSLLLQGGVLTPAEATAFLEQPFAAQAVQLRRWDDLAKVPGLPTPDLAHFQPFLVASQRH